MGLGPPVVPILSKNPHGGNQERLCRRITGLLRHTGVSDGEFDPFLTEVGAEDAYYTEEWTARQPWSNGKVGMQIHGLQCRAC